MVLLDIINSKYRGENIDFLESRRLLPRNNPEVFGFDVLEFLDAITPPNNFPEKDNLLWDRYKKEGWFIS